MRWFTRTSVGLALALCAWITLPGGAGAAPRPPEIHTVIEGRNADRIPVVIIVGTKVSALRRLQVVADDGIRPRYEREGELVVKSGKLSVWKLPVGIEVDRGPDTYDLLFFYGRRDKPLPPLNVRLDFGSASPDSVSESSIRSGTIDRAHVSAGFLADLEDASTLNGFDAAHFTDASNVDAGTLDPARFSAWDDLLNFENRVGTAAGQLAPGDHNHDAAYPTRAELAANTGVLNDPNNAVDWSQLKNVPAGLSDGTDMDTTYTAGSGLLLTGTAFSVNFDANGNSLLAARADHSHPAGAGLDLSSGTLSVQFAGTGGSSTVSRSDHNHDAAYATAAHNHDASYFTKAEQSSTGIINTSTNPVDWTRLKNVPLDLADGVDNDTTYGAGAGLVFTQGEFRVDFAGDGALDKAARSDHDHGSIFADLNHTHDTRYFTQSQLTDAGGVINTAQNPVSWTQLKDVPNTIADGVDSDTTYAAGTGLNLTSGTFDVLFQGTGTANTASRSDHDHTGVYELAGHDHDLRYVTKSVLADANGTLNTSTNPVDWSQLKNVPSEFADGTDDGTNFMAGAGLNLVSESFSVVFSGSGAASSVARSDHDHTGVYEPSFAKGAGLVLSSGTLSVGFGGDGVALTASRSDHLHASDYYNKTELNDAGGTLNTSTNPVDWSQLKNVPAGFADGTDDSAVYTAGDGLALSGTEFRADLLSASTQNGTDTTVARSDHLHDGTYLKANAVTAGHVTLTPTQNQTLLSVLHTGGQNSPAIFAENSGGNGTTSYTTKLDNTGVFGSYRPSTGSGVGVHGSSLSASGTGVKGTAPGAGTGVLGTSGSGPGVSGSSGNGDGVYGVSGLYGVHGLGNGRGVFGESQDVGLNTYGVYGKAVAATGTGVYGEVTSLTGASFGLRGKSSSNAGSGVHGEADNLGGTTFGVRGEAASTAGTGVHGEATATTGTTFGVYGESSSTAGVGVSGLASATTGATFGVLGESESGFGAGVKGVNSAAGTSTSAYGVHGTSAATDGSGVFGESTGTGAGVSGKTGTNLHAGVRGENTSNGTAAYGVSGLTASTNTGAAGVYGANANDTSTGTGVLGEGQVGVQGTSSNSTGSGVHGLHSATSGAGFGVHGRTTSSAGAGVYAEAATAGANSVALLVNHTDTNFNSGDLAVFRDKGTNVARIDRAGQGIFNGGTATSGADFAESVAVNAPKSAFEPGDVMIIDRKGTRRFALSTTAESPRVAGIYSTRPGVLARPGDVANSDAWKDTEIPLAITGIVPCKVSGEGGAIEAGDLLVSASIAGHARKAPANAKQGTIVAKALGAFDGKTGKIEVLITMR